MGTLSWTITILAANGALMATLLVAASGNRQANCLLASLVSLISLRLMIYVLGFVGMYDDHPWITFAPLDASLAFGPLVWLYVVSLTRGGLPRRWQLHLAPAALQLGYSLVAFVLPLDLKMAWFRGPHLQIVEPVGLAALLVSTMVYLTLAWRRHRDYQSWLDSRFADRERWRLGWIAAILASFSAMVAVVAVATLVNFTVVPLDYFGRTPVVVASSLLAYALGLLGWHNAGLVLPRQWIGKAPGSKEPRASRPAAAFAEWSRRIEVQDWWREEGITLGVVAKRLGVSDRSLSRGLSEGGGKNFNAFINDMRIAAVKRELVDDGDRDLLTIALDCGFSSKASFNRAFRRSTGMTPTSWRRSALHIPPVMVAGET